MPFRNPGDPGVCYLAPTLEGVVLERVLRDLWRVEIDLANTKAHHALSRCTVQRDLILVDLMVAGYTVHRHQLADLAAPPPYVKTQQWAATWAAQTVPLVADGIAYGSRFSGITECIALWDRAAGKLAWAGSPEPLGTDEAALEHACEKLGLTLTR